MDVRWCDSAWLLSIAPSNATMAISNNSIIICSTICRLLVPMASNVPISWMRLRTQKTNTSDSVAIPARLMPSVPMARMRSMLAMLLITLANDAALSVNSSLLHSSGKVLTRLTRSGKVRGLEAKYVARVGCSEPDSCCATAKEVMIWFSA